MYVNPTNTSVCEEISEVSANTVCTKEDTAPGIPCELDDSDDNSVNFSLIYGNENESLFIHIYFQLFFPRLGRRICRCTPYVPTYGFMVLGWNFGLAKRLLNCGTKASSL